MIHNIQLNQNDINSYNAILLQSTDDNVILSNTSMNNFIGGTVSEALLELKQNMPTISTVAPATPNISIDNNGLITATSTQQTGYVTSDIKINTKQVPIATQSEPTISVNNEGLVTSSFELGSGYVVAETHSQTYKRNLVEVATPSISNNGGTLTATATQTSGLTSGGTKSQTLQLTTKGTETIIPKTSNQTISSGRYLTGTQTIQGSSNLIPSNIKSGVSIFNVAGSLQTDTSIYVAPLSVTINNTYPPYNSLWGVPMATMFYINGAKSGGQYKFGDNYSTIMDRTELSAQNRTTIEIPYQSVLYFYVSDYFSGLTIGVDASPSGAVSSVQQLGANFVKVTLKSGYSSVTLTLREGDDYYE